MIGVWTCVIIACGGIIVMALICELDRAAERKDFKIKIAELENKAEDLETAFADSRRLNKQLEEELETCKRLNKQLDGALEVKYKKQITELQNTLSKKNETIKMQNVLLNNELPHLKRELSLQGRRNARLANQIQQMMVLKAKYEALKDTAEAQNGK